MPPVSTVVRGDLQNSPVSPEAKVRPPWLAALIAESSGFGVIAALSAAVVCFASALAVATAHNGLTATQALGLVDLGCAAMWLITARRWIGVADPQTAAFWTHLGYGALAVSGYGVLVGLSYLVDLEWLAWIGSLSALGAVPPVIAALRARPTRQQGRNAGWSTVIDVAIVVIAAGGPFAANLVSPAWQTRDFHAIVLSGIWMAMLFLLGGFLLAAYRTAPDRSPAGLLALGAMALMMTLAALIGAISIARFQMVPPWWADSIYALAILIGMVAPALDRPIAKPDQPAPTTASAWSTTRPLLPYVAIVGLLLATLIEVFWAGVSDLTKSIVATMVAVSCLVSARHLLQVSDNRQLIKEQLQLLEESRRSEARIGDLSRAKTELMSNLNHEFRNALVGISGFSELLRDQDVSTDEVKTFASDIYNDAGRLTRMINEMLDVDRMEAGRVKVDLKPIDINATVLEAVARARVSSQKCRIETRLDGRLPLVPADSDRLFQVLSNLLSNAVKYSPSGGDVVVTTTLEASHVHLQVSDSGLGITADDLPRLFQRFARVGKSENKISGTGLGLVMCRLIVELHGGTIWAQSKPNEGSIFHFTLPLAGVVKVASPDGAAEVSRAVTANDPIS